MHKMLYFLTKAGKSPQRWGLRSKTPVGLRRLGAPLPDPLPELLPSSPVTVIFSKAFVALTSLLSKRNRNNLEIVNVLLLPLISYFKHFLLQTLRRVP